MSKFLVPSIPVLWYALFIYGLTNQRSVFMIIVINYKYPDEMSFVLSVELSKISVIYRCRKWDIFVILFIQFFIAMELFLWTGHYFYVWYVIWNDIMHTYWIYFILYVFFYKLSVLLFFLDSFVVFLVRATTFISCRFSKIMTQSKFWW